MSPNLPSDHPAVCAACDAVNVAVVVGLGRALLEHGYVEEAVTLARVAR